MERWTHPAARSPGRSSIINLAHGLNLGVTEGVEHMDQLAFPCAEHCDQAQRYVLSRPVPVAALTRLLHQGGPRMGTKTGSSQGPDHRPAV